MARADDILGSITEVVKDTGREPARVFGKRKL